MLPKAPVRTKDTQTMNPVFIPSFTNLCRNQPITVTATIRNKVRNSLANIPYRSHATILSKVDVEPICDSDALVPVHVSLNPNLDNLVYN